MRLTVAVFMGILLLLSACSPVVEQNQPTKLPATLTVSQKITLPGPNTITPQAVNSPAVETQIPRIKDTPFVSPSPSLPQICSPLEGITISELTQPDLLKNLFQPPRQGMDDGHHGVDFAYWSRGERKTMLGLPVLSAMTGRISGIIKNREPYGNAIIIETPLDELPTIFWRRYRYPPRRRLFNLRPLYSARPARHRNILKLPGPFTCCTRILTKHRWDRSGKSDLRSAHW